MIRAVIFDVDGTLVDTNQAHIEAWEEAFAAHGLQVPRERIRPEVGKGGDQLVPSIAGEAAERREGAAIRDAHDRSFLRSAREQHFRVFPGVPELFAALRGRGLLTALSTSSKKKFLEATENSAGSDLASLADVVVTADEVAASKPAPDLVEVTLGKLGVDAGRCVFVGDTVHDGEAARRAGVAFVGVLCGGTSAEANLRAAGARSVWRDPAELLHHLDEALAPGEQVGRR